MSTVHRTRARRALLPALALAALLLAPSVSRWLAPPAPGPWWATLCRTADASLALQVHEVLEACGHCSLLGSALPPPAWGTPAGAHDTTAHARPLPDGHVAAWRPASPAQPRAPPAGLPTA